MIYLIVGRGRGITYVKIDYSVSKRQRPVTKPTCMCYIVFYRRWLHLHWSSTSSHLAVFEWLVASRFYFISCLQTYPTTVWVGVITNICLAKTVSRVTLNVFRICYHTCLVFYTFGNLTYTYSYWVVSVQHSNWGRELCSSNNDNKYNKQPKVKN